MSVKATDRVGLAILLTIVSIVLFDFMGLLIKFLSDNYRAIELSAYRNLFGVPPSLIALYSARAWHRQGRPWRIRQWKLASLRGLCVALAQVLFYYSLGKLAFATANTITYCNAFFMTALAVPLLGERVGALRWSAVLIGFLGVVLIVGPGSDSFTLDALAPLGAAFLYALSGVLARRLDDDLPSALANIYSNVVALIGSFILVFATGGFSQVGQASDFWYIGGMGAFGGLAVLCMVVAYRMAEQSNLAPFTYFGILTAFVLGWLFFDEAPIDDLFPGVLFIVFGGALVLWRERRLKRQALARQ